MGDFERIWKNQCEAARGIRERFGLESALRYLVGEKLPTFLEAAETRPEFEAELGAFVAEVKDVFEPRELAAYLEGNGHPAGGPPGMAERLKELLLA